MRSLLLFILVLSTASASSFTLEQGAGAAPVECETGELVCCDGDFITDVDTGVLVGCDSYSEDLVKCEHPEMRHCCSYIISGVGIQCGDTRALECPVPGYEMAKRHVRPRVPDGCSPPGKLGQAKVDSQIADAPVDLYGDGSLDMFLAEGGLPDGSMDQNLWSSPMALDDGLTAVSLGGGGLPASTYGDDASSLALFDADSGGGSPNMYLDG